jgi:beta-aspartyl-peptidase (threonine type)
VTLARNILKDGRHVLWVGDGALAFARQAGVPECDPAELITERQRRRYLERAARGTVGAGALDRHGTIVAATSTGGIAGKLPGRVGDSALIGCGAYADSTLGGVSCTGDGEAITRILTNSKPGSAPFATAAFSAVGAPGWRHMAASRTGRETAGTPARKSAGAPQKFERQGGLPPVSSV